MIKKFKSASKLLKFNNFRVVDTSQSSEKYFRLFDIPDRMYLGKNGFRIRANKSNLVANSLIYIDIIDGNGNLIYHEIADLIGEDDSRLITVYVYSDTSPGEATIYIGGRAMHDEFGNFIPYSPNEIETPNLIWKKSIVIIPTSGVSQDIIFNKPPVVSSIERFESYRSIDDNIRTISFSGSFNLSSISSIPSYKKSNNNKSAPDFKENVIDVVLDPTLIDNKVESKQIEIPRYESSTTLKDDNGNFTPEFLGGEIIIRNLDSIIPEYTNIPDFSASIIDVIDKSTVKIYPGFSYSSNQQEILKFKGATNATASYYSSVGVGNEIATQSFVELQFQDLEPIVGSVESIQISYKPYGSFGEFSSIGNFPLTKNEYLVNISGLTPTKNDLIETRTGIFETSSSFGEYWDHSGEFQYNILESNILNDGISFNITGSVENLEDILSFKLKSEYLIDSHKSTEYLLSFDVHVEDSMPGHQNQIDVYISGSGVMRDIERDNITKSPKQSLNYGTYIGSFNSIGIGSTKTEKMFFEVVDSKPISPVFVIRSGQKIHLTDISISPRNVSGYSPNQAKLFVPISSLRTDTELMMNFEYLNSKGSKANKKNVLYGLTFSGSGLDLYGSKLLSGSTQISEEISGSFNSISSSLSTSINELSSSLHEVAFSGDYYDLQQPDLTVINTIVTNQTSSISKDFPIILNTSALPITGQGTWDVATYKYSPPDDGKTRIYELNFNFSAIMKSGSYISATKYSASVKTQDIIFSSAQQDTIYQRYNLMSVITVPPEYDFALSWQSGGGGDSTIKGSGVAAFNKNTLTLKELSSI